MKSYYVEGLYIAKNKTKKAREVVEPFSKVIWAENPQEALLLAEEELKGGMWKEGPKVSLTTEEDRMRAMGSPELPI